MNKFLILSISLFAMSAFGMQQQSANISRQSSMDRPTTITIQPVPTVAGRRSSLPSPQIPRTPPRSTSETYIPQNIDMTEFLSDETILCFKISRYLLQPVRVVVPLLATACVGVGEYYIKDNPRTAAVWNACGLAFSISDFIFTTLAIKVDNKLRRNDHYIGGRQAETQENLDLGNNRVDSDAVDETRRNTQEQL